MLKINNKDEGYITFLFDYILFTCNAYFRMNFLAKKITRKVPFNFILQAIYLLYLFSKLFTCIILLTNNESLNFPSKELTTKNPSDPILNSRAIGRSENPRGQPPPPRVEIGLTDQPKTGERALCVEMGFYADISWESKCNIEINV